MTKLNLYLVRHGQTYFNIYNKLQGWSNSPLTEKGKENAVAAGKRLQNIHFTAAFCSDTTRAMETIQKILDLNQADSVTKPDTAPYFREEFYGSYEGTNMDIAWYNAGAPTAIRTFTTLLLPTRLARPRTGSRTPIPSMTQKIIRNTGPVLTRGLP